MADAFKIVFVAEGGQAIAEAQKVRATLGDVGEEARKVGESSGIGFGGLGSKALLAVGGITAVTSTLTAALSAYAEAEAAEVALNTALQNTGQFSAEASDSILKLSDQLQGLTNVSGETWTGAAQRLVEFGARVEELPALLQTVEGIAGRMGGNVQGAADMVARTLAGNARGLAQFGVHLDDTATRSERLNALQGVAAATAGKLRAETETLSGSLTALKNAAGELVEDLGAVVNTGGWINTTLSGLAQNLRAVHEGNWAPYAQAVQEAASQHENLRSAVPGVSTAVEGLGDKVKTAEEKTSDAAAKVAELTTNLNHAQTAARNAATALDDLATAEAELAGANIDQQELSGKLSGPEATAARARLKAGSEREKLQREEAAQKEEIAREQSTRAALEKQRDAVKPSAAETMEKALHPENFDEARTKSYDAAQKAVTAINAQLEELDASIAARQRALSTLDVKRQAVDAREGVEVGKAEREARKAANEEAKKIVAAEIKAVETALKTQQKDSAEWQSNVDKLATFKEQLLDLGDQGAAIAGTPANRFASAAEKEGVDVDAKLTKDEAREETAKAAKAEAEERAREAEKDRKEREEAEKDADENQLKAKGRVRGDDRKVRRISDGRAVTDGRTRRSFADQEADGPTDFRSALKPGQIDTKPKGAEDLKTASAEADNFSSNAKDAAKSLSSAAQSQGEVATALQGFVPDLKAACTDIINELKSVRRELGTLRSQIKNSRTGGGR